jgi:hypothetical protein
MAFHSTAQGLLFPNSDRPVDEAVGHWLSGFTDGEGSFCLHSKNVSPSAHFAISLRDDDRAILESIRAYWGCGTIHGRLRIRSRKMGNSQPQSVYYVCRAAHMAEIVVPHFDRFPLRAKKARDFAIWREGVLLLHRVHCIPRRWAAGGRGFLPKWTPEAREQFEHLIHRITAIRIYQPRSDQPA